MTGYEPDEVIRLTSPCRLYKKALDQFGFDAGVRTEFFDSNKRCFILFEFCTNPGKYFTCSSVAEARNVYNVFRIYNNAVGDWIHKGFGLLNQILIILSPISTEETQ
jgi:hypothetical protein